ncbi:putative F-box/kelch-repeat protein At1g15680 [Quercus lobata]|uniref:putative F-box/kelch-repeat protein At1g15680 n=1 Tax=Quercus lobata TaxID=97700 RepID=UPI00124876FB|nr:putative F-box/kelch-repeat protein At1g15680 [Quercus lobata]
MDPCTCMDSEEEFASIDSHFMNNRSSPSTMDDLPDWVLMEILVLLPLCTVVLTCKWVSKRWFTLISSPYFARRFVAQHSQQPQPFTLLYQYGDIDNVERRLPITPANSESECELKPVAAYLRDRHRGWIRASCNDLLLWIESSKWVVEQQQPGDWKNVVVYTVINPITRQWLKLPPRPLPLPQPLLPLRAGIISGYDDSNDTQISSSFRVVLILSTRTNLSQFIIHVFSSDTGEWGDSVVLCPPNLGEFRWSLTSIHTVPCKGLLFWPIGGGRLLGFDPFHINNSNSSTCCVIEQPVEFEPFHEINCLGLCHGCLRTCQVSGNAHTGLRVWELKDFDNENNGSGAGGKWCLKHELCFSQMVSEKSPSLTEYINDRIWIIPLDISVLAFHPNDGDIMYLLIQSEVVICNLQSRTLEVFCDINHSEHGFFTTPNTLTFVLPSWPTPIPSSPLEKQNVICRLPQ